MGLYRKDRSATEHRTEVSPIGYQALTLALTVNISKTVADTAKVTIND